MSNKYTCTEHQIQNAIREALSLRGWCVFRANCGGVVTSDGKYYSSGLPKGFSDLFAVKGGKVVFIEVKKPGGRLLPHQEIFLKTMSEIYGCVSGVCYSVNDALKLCGEAVLTD